MSLFSLIINNLTSIINYLSMLSFIFGCKLTLKRRNSLWMCIILYCFIAILLNHFTASTLILSINLFLCIFISFLLLDIDFFKRIIIVCIVLFIEAIVHAITQFILNHYSIHNDAVIKINICFIIMISSYILGNKLKKLKFNFINENNLYLYCFFMTTLLLGIVLATITAFFNHHYQFYFFIVIICAILIILNTIGTFIYILKKEQNIKYQKDLQSNQALVSIQARYIEQLKETYQELRILKHDMHSFFHNIEYLLKMKNYDELEKLISELQTLTSSSTLSVCSNIYIAATIHPFLSIMKRDHIVFSLDYQIFQEIRMKSIELCALFHNLIKNAIEANQYQLEHKEISLTLNQKHSSFIITLVNTISHEFSMENIIYKQTIKDDKLEHGLGLISIDNIVSSYHGNTVYEVKDQKLYTSIILLNVFDISK